MLNAIVAINPEAVNEARERDKTNLRPSNLRHSNTCKDNTNVEGMPTTAGTHLLRNNMCC
jgi:amidase